MLGYAYESVKSAFCYIVYIICYFITKGNTLNHASLQCVLQQ